MASSGTRSQSDSKPSLLVCLFISLFVCLFVVIYWHFILGGIAMRPADFTLEQIIEAGKVLQSAGRAITGFALRKEVGGGNPNRLKQVWDEHVASHVVAEAEPVTELPVEVAQELAHVSEALVARLASMVVGINDRAVKASDRRAAEVVRAAGEQRDQADRELVDAAQTVEDLEQQLDSLQESRDLLVIEFEKVRTAKQEQAVELAQVRERLTAVEKAAKEAAASASAQVKLLQGQLEEQRRSEQMAREREAQATGALHQMEKQHLVDAEVCQQLRTEVRALSAALAETNAVSDGRAHDLTQAKADVKAMREELKAAHDAQANGLGREQAALAQIKALQDALSEAVKAPVKQPQKPAAKTSKAKAQLPGTQTKGD
ncbi:DNA-binding protein [Pseudomonas amygdali]